MKIEALNARLDNSLIIIISNATVSIHEDRKPIKIYQFVLKQLSYDSPSQAHRTDTQRTPPYSSPTSRPNSWKDNMPAFKVYNQLLSIYSSYLFNKRTFVYPLHEHPHPTLFTVMLHIHIQTRLQFQRLPDYRVDEEI